MAQRRSQDPQLTPNSRGCNCWAMAEACEVCAGRDTGCPKCRPAAPLPDEPPADIGPYAASHYMSPSPLTWLILAPMIAKAWWDGLLWVYSGVVGG